MTKKLITILAVAISISALTAGFSQDKGKYMITYDKADTDDLSAIIQSIGVEIHKVLLPIDTTKSYRMTLIMEQYVDGEQKFSDRFEIPPTFRRLISENKTVDYFYNRIIFTFNQIDPKNMKFGFNVPNAMQFTMPVAKMDSTTSFYKSVPFKMQEFATEVKIPVLLFGASWFDKRINTQRFCLSDELTTDMDDDIFSLSPHYYVISLMFEDNPDYIIYID